MTKQDLMTMAIRRHFKQYGYQGVQLSLPFDVSREVILKAAQRLGVKSDVRGGRKQPAAPKPRKVDPYISLLTGWYPTCMTEEGALWQAV